MANTFKFGNGIWATKKGSTLAYNDENGNYKPLPFNFERASGATRVNKEGLIEVVSNNKSRIDFTDSADGSLLLEPSRTNLITYSEDFSNSSWILSGTNPPVITTSQFISPDGNQTASRLQIPSTNSVSILQQSFSHTSGTQYTVSAYVKSNASTNQQFRLYGDFGSPTGISGILIATSEWQRFTFTYTATGTGARSGGFYYVPDTESDIQIYGFQAEEGSYATSYIPTQGSTSTRDADVCDGAGNEQVFNDSEGVLYCESADINSDSTKMITINDGGQTNEMRIDFKTNNEIQAVFTVGSNPQALISTTSYNTSEINKIAFKYKENNFALWINGIEVGASNTGSTVTTNTFKTLEFERGSGLFQFYGNTKQIQYYNTILTDVELEYMTSYRSLNEMVTELNLNAL